METPARRPYTGSCHCGATRYIIFLTLPHAPRPVDLPLCGQRMYRCNCTLCHKAGFFHLRTGNPCDDFFLLAPLDPLAEDGSGTLTAYRRREGRPAWFFCRTCGVRCFNFNGEGEVSVVDLEKLGVSEDARKGVRAEAARGGEGQEDGRGRLVKAWRPKQGFVDDIGKGYLSVNAHSLNAGQDGLDLTKWTEEKRVLYMNLLDDGADPILAYDRPFHDGAY